MLEEYALRIEELFYLKENERLSNRERNGLMLNILNDLKKQSMRRGHIKAVKICKNALDGIESANTSTY
jgi:hypothetical protein